MFVKLQTHIESTISVTFLPRWILPREDEDCVFRLCVCEQKPADEKTQEKLGGLSRSVTAAMPSGRRFEEDTWDQRTWTMSWGVTLNWDEPLFIPRALLLLFFPISLLSRFIHLRSLWSPSLFSLHNLIYSTLLCSQSFHSLLLSLTFLPCFTLLGIAKLMQTSLCMGVSHSLIAYLTISTHTFSAIIQGPSPSCCISSVAIFSQTIL